MSKTLIRQLKLRKYCKNFDKTVETLKNFETLILKDKSQIFVETI